MPVVVSLLRGVNLARYNRIKMDELKEVYESLGLRQPTTYVQSGNVVFATGERDPARLARRIEQAIERRFGFRPAVIVRTPVELRATIAANPFAGRRDVAPGRLLVTFLPADPGPEACRELLEVEAAPEEVHICGREVYIYFPNGMARAKLSTALLDRILKTQGTGRNWNTVTRLLEIAEGMAALASRAASRA